MRRQHLDIAIEQFIWWREQGLEHWDMLAALGIGINVPGDAQGYPTAGDVVVALAEASDELERKLRWRGLNAA